MTAEAPQRPVTEGVRSLEVRWIFPGQLETALAGWFARFPAVMESREDTYLLDPQLRGLSVKVREGGALEVKVYRGSPGILEVAGRARGRLEAWQKWSFPFSPLPPHSGDPAGWRPVRKRRRITRFSLASGPIAAPAPGLGGEPGCEVGTHRGPHARPGLVDPGIRGDRLRQPAPQRTPGHRRARVRPGPARWRGTRARMNPGPTRNGCACSRAPTLAPTPEGCPSAPGSYRTHAGQWIGRVVPAVLLKLGRTVLRWASTTRTKRQVRTPRVSSGQLPSNADPRARCSCAGWLSSAARALVCGGLVPGGVAAYQRRRREPVHEDRQPDGQVAGRDDRRGVREMRVLDDHREHDRGQPARAEPADERDRRSPRVRAPQRDRHRHHPHDREAQHGVQRDLPAQVLKRRAEQHGAENQERHAVEHRPGLLGEAHHARGFAASRAGRTARRPRTRR